MFVTHGSDHGETTFGLWPVQVGNQHVEVLSGNLSKRPFDAYAGNYRTVLCFQQFARQE
jgi:hypothetical protein